MDGIYNYGSWNLSSPLANDIAGASFIITAGMRGVVYLLYARAVTREKGRQLEMTGLTAAPAAAMLRFVTAAVFVFILFSKVFSMQYLVWLCPLLPLVTGRRRLPLFACFLLAAAFSQFVYPYFYGQFEQFAPALVVMMFLRNLLLALCLVLVLLPEGPQPGRETEARLKSAAV